MDIYTFIITSIIIILLPGTGVIYTISNGIIKGKKASVIAAIGCTAGIIPHLFVSIMCSSVLIQSGREFFLILKIAGSLYLCYLGVGMIKSQAKVNFLDEVEEKKGYQIICRGVLINLLNPKLTLFFFSFLPQYVSSNSENYIRESLILGIIFMILTFLVFVVYGISAGTMKVFAMKSEKRMKRIQQIFGIIFITFAGHLALSSL